LLHRASKHVADKMEIDLVYKKLDLLVDADDDEDENENENEDENENEEEEKHLKNKSKNKNLTKSSQGAFNLDLVLQAWLEFDDDELNINEVHESFGRVLLNNGFSEGK